MQKGTYILVVKLEKDKQIQVGKLGDFLFEKGYYCYVGSAMNGLEQRIGRHQSKNKKLHQIADGTPVKKFGSSDCNCQSHLFYFQGKPENDF